MKIYDIITVAYILRLSGNRHFSGGSIDHMASLTKKAIRESFVRLLNEKPYNKISVRDIVEDCGINRNSFYYHFSDIPSLMDDIITDWFNALTDQFSKTKSLSELYSLAVERTLENKKALLHIFNSVNRVIFEDYLLKFCSNVTAVYIDTVYPDTNFREDDKRIIIHHLSCDLFGIYIEWLKSGIPESAADDGLRMLELSRGFMDIIISRSASK